MTVYKACIDFVCGDPECALLNEGNSQLLCGWRTPQAGNIRCNLLRLTLLLFPLLTLRCPLILRKLPLQHLAYLAVFQRASRKVCLFHLT